VSPENGTGVSRAARRRTAQPAHPESVAPTPASEQDIQTEIARLAYFLWEARGGVAGSAEEDWLRAEQEILTRSKA